MPMSHARHATVLPLLIAASLTMAWLAVAYAQIHPDPKTGKQIAEKLCVGCHIVGPTAEGTVQADVPSFMRIANEPGQSAEMNAGAIVIPHPPMPNIHLTREEISDVAAYILTLRGI